MARWCCLAVHDAGRVGWRLALAGTAASSRIARIFWGGVNYMSVVTFGREPWWVRLVSILSLLLAGFVSVALVYSYTLQEPSTLKWNSWAFYEWLINFEGGFVRRGLAGHVIRHMSFASEIEIVNIVVFVLFLLFVVISLIFSLMFIPGGRSTALFILSPMSFLAMAVGNHYYYRKEIIFYICVFLVAVLMALLRERDSRLARCAILAIIGLWTVVGMFIHEGVIFFCVFIFSLIVYRRVGRRFRSAAVLSYLALSFLMFGVMAYFSGNEAVAEQIWLSLSDEGRSLVPGAGPAGGISAIGWSTRYAVSLTLSALLSGMAAYYMLSLLIVYLVVAFIVSAQRGVSAAIVITSPQFIFGFSLIIMSFLPLFVVAWDWGRVITGVYVVSLTFFSLRLDGAVVAGAAPWLSVAAKPALLTTVGLIVLWLTKVPECCIRTTDGNGAPWSLLGFARQLIP